MPTNRTIRIRPSAASTWRAFCASGVRKAGTPSDTASIPVRAAQPDANARSARNRVSASMPRGAAPATTGGATSPPSHRTKPHAIMTRYAPTKR